LALSLVLAVSACASQLESPPTVGNATLSAREISPGEGFEVSFNLNVADPATVERLYVRGLPKNSVLAGTQTELRLPEAPNTLYESLIVVRKPAADGQYNLELVIERSGRTFIAPLGPLAVRDIPSRILHAQFVRGSHAADNCLAETKLLKLEYAVTDDNGAADFVAPAIAPADQDAQDLVFFPRWEPVAWLDGELVIALNGPIKDSVKEELVTSDIRIFCRVPENSLYEFVIKGQNVSSLSGKSMIIDSAPVSYFVE
jgi:hypothetical protein